MSPTQHMATALCVQLSYADKHLPRAGQMARMLKEDVRQSGARDSEIGGNGLPNPLKAAVKLLGAQPPCASIALSTAVSLGEPVNVREQSAALNMCAASSECAVRSSASDMLRAAALCCRAGSGNQARRPAWRSRAPSSLRHNQETGGLRQWVHAWGQIVLALASAVHTLA